MRFVFVDHINGEAREYNLEKTDIYRMFAQVVCLTTDNKHITKFDFRLNPNKTGTTAYPGKSIEKKTGGTVQCTQKAKINFPFSMWFLFKFP